MTGMLLSSGSLSGDDVVNAQGEDLGNIKDLMIDTQTGKIEYAVLSFGGFLGLGDKYFAIPYNQMHVDAAEKRVVLNVDKERLKDAPGFDKSDWPNFADQTFRSTIDSFYV